MQDFALVASGPNTANGKHLEASRQYHYAAAEGDNGELTDRREVVWPGRTVQVMMFRVNQGTPKIKKVPTVTGELTVFKRGAADMVRPS